MIYLIKFGKCCSLVLFVIGLVIFGDMKILSTLKIWLFYTQGNKNKIISHTFLLDHSVIKKCVRKPHLDSHKMKHMKRNENKKKTIAYFLIPKKVLKSTRKSNIYKLYLQFPQFIFYIFPNILKLCMFCLIFKVIL